MSLLVLFGSLRRAMTSGVLADPEQPVVAPDQRGPAGSRCALRE